MDMREEFTIGDRHFSNMAGFYDEVERVFTFGLDWKISRNPNAPYDILWAVLDGMNMDIPSTSSGWPMKKVRGLGKETMDTITEIILDTDYSRHTCTLERL